MNRFSLGTTAVLVSAVALSGCSDTKPTTFDPAAIQDIQKRAASQVVLHELNALPKSIPDVTRTTADPATTRPSLTPRLEPPTARLRLPEIIQRAVVNNKEVRVASYQPAIDENRVLEAEARFDPTFYTNWQGQQQFPQGVIANQLTPPEVRSYVLSTGFKQDTDIGTQLDVHVQSQKQDFFSQSSFSTARIRGKSWDQQVVFQIKQPLLRDFGGQVNRARIVIARNDQKISRLDARDSLEKVLQKIEEVYWSLVSAEQDLRIQEKLLHDAETTMDILIKRAANDVNMFQVSQAREAVETRNYVGERARAQVVELSNQLKSLMNDPDYPVAGSTLILPADLPLTVPVKLALPDQIAIALQNRLELLQQNLRIDSARIIINAARNNLLPRLDIVANIGYEGFDFTFSDSLDSFNDGQLINWGLGFQFEVPIGNRSARAIEARTLLQHTQAIVEWQRQAEQVAFDVKTAMHAIETAWLEAVAAQRAVFAAEDVLSNLQKLEDTGQPLTPEWVRLKLDQQVTWGIDMSRFNQALADYNLALANLEKAKGTLLMYNNVEMREGGRNQP
jgi:outer membrane protein